MKKRISKKKKSRMNRTFDKLSKALRSGNKINVNKAVKAHIKSLKQIGKSPGLYEYMIEK
jgi:hypothetical protein